MKKFIYIFILISNIMQLLYSQEKKLGNDYFSTDLVTNKVMKSVEKIHFPDTNGNYVLHNDIDSFNGGYLLRNINTLNYQTIIYDYKLGKIEKEYLLKNDLVKNPIEAAYFAKDYFYSLENSDNSLCLLKRKFDGEIIGKHNLKLDNAKNIKTMIVDEVNKMIILESLNDRIFLYSLSKEALIFENAGRLLFNISNETGKLYFSMIHEVVCIDYVHDLTQKVFQTFLISKHERIADLIEINYQYVLVTEVERFNLFNRIIFNTPDWSNVYYSCALTDKKFVKNEKLFERKEGIFF